MAKLQRINTPDRIINMIQDNVANILEPLSNIPLNSGQILQSVRLVSGSNNVPHKLERKPLGWFIVRQRSAGTVYDTQDTNPNPQTFLRLQASATIIVDLFVF